MPSVEYLAPHRLAQALEALSESESSQTVVWAGGTALGPLLRRGLLAPRRLLGVERLGELAGLRIAEDGGLWIGAVTTLRELEKSEVVGRRIPALARTAAVVGNPRVRAVATVGGHLVHADPAQDLPPILVALDAEVRLLSLRGSRILPLEEFLLGPFQTALAQDELLVEVRVPPSALNRRTGYVRYTPRSALDCPTVGVAVSVQLDAEGVCRQARVVVGGAGPKALRVVEAERVLVGRPLTPQSCMEAAREVEVRVDPWDDNRGSAEYKRAMARVWVERLLRQLSSHGR